MGFEGGLPWVETAGVERAHLLERTRRHHGVEARGDAGFEFRAVRSKKYFDGARPIDERRHALAMPGGKRPPGGLDHFEGAHDAHAVAELERRRAFGIASGEVGVECRGALGGKPCPY